VFDSQRYQIFWEVVGLEQGPLSLGSIIEELLEEGLEIQEQGREDPLCWPCDTLYLRKLALTSPTSGGHSVGIVHSGIKATVFFSVYMYMYVCVCVWVCGVETIINIYICSLQEIIPVQPTCLFHM
jgi:hypothetical protein